MSADLPINPGDEWEDRLTALLLGELPPDEAAALREAIARDPELARLHDRLQKTVGLLRDAYAQNAVGETEPSSTPLQMSEKRRLKLLATFRTIALPVAPTSPTQRAWWRITPRQMAMVAAVMMIGFLLVAMILPNFVKARRSMSSLAFTERSRASGYTSMAKTPAPHLGTPESVQVEGLVRSTNSIVALRGAAEIPTTEPQPDIPSYNDVFAKRYGLPTRSEVVRKSVESSRGREQSLALNQPAGGPSSGGIGGRSGGGGFGGGGGGGGDTGGANYYRNRSGGGRTPSTPEQPTSARVQIVLPSGGQDAGSQFSKNWSSPAPSDLQDLSRTPDHYVTVTDPNTGQSVIVPVPPPEPGDYELTPMANPPQPAFITVTDPDSGQAVMVPVPPPEESPSEDLRNPVAVNGVSAGKPASTVAVPPLGDTPNLGRLFTTDESRKAVDASDEAQLAQKARGGSLPAIQFSGSPGPAVPPPEAQPIPTPDTIKFLALSSAASTVTDREAKTAAAPPSSLPAPVAQRTPVESDDYLSKAAQPSPGAKPASSAPTSTMSSRLSSEQLVSIERGWNGQTPPKEDSKTDFAWVEQAEKKNRGDLGGQVQAAGRFDFDTDGLAVAAPAGSTRAAEPAGERWFLDQSGVEHKQSAGLGVVNGSSQYGSFAFQDGGAARFGNTAAGFGIVPTDPQSAPAERSTVLETDSTANFWDSAQAGKDRYYFENGRRSGVARKEFADSKELAEKLSESEQLGVDVNGPAPVDETIKLEPLVITGSLITSVDKTDAMARDRLVNEEFARGLAREEEKQVLRESLDDSVRLRDELRAKAEAEARALSELRVQAEAKQKQVAQLSLERAKVEAEARQEARLKTRALAEQQPVVAPGEPDAFLRQLLSEQTEAGRDKVRAKAEAERRALSEARSRAALEESYKAEAAAESKSKAGGLANPEPGAKPVAPEAGQKLELAKAVDKLADAASGVQSLARTAELAPIKAKPATPPPVPQPEITAADNPFSTFSLNVSDVSFKLAAASLEKNQMPDPGSIRTEEFINAFDYHDPAPGLGQRVGFNWERSRYPFAHNRELVRFAVKTAAQGREAGRPLNLVLCLDNSGSMERADRVEIIREALRVLAGQLKPQDKISVVAFSRTARLWIDGLPGNRAGELVEQVGNLAPQGGTNLEDALRTSYETAARHYLVNGVNRVVMLTDGAANLGDVEAGSLKQMVEISRKQGIALDCFGIGWEGYNDDLLEELSRNGDGRYGFVNTPEEAATEFVGQLAGALQVAASDVKVQVEFNPRRVTSYRQIGYAKHQLTKEQFRDNRVDAAELGAAEAGNALYVIESNPNGEGAIATVRVRYKLPGTSLYEEKEWLVPYTGPALTLEQSKPSLRLAATASAFSEWLSSSPYAAEATPARLQRLLQGVPEHFRLDPRPKRLESMIRQARSLAGQ